MGIEHQTLDRWIPDRTAKKEREDGRKNNAANLGPYKGKPDQLARKFRLAIRELMTQQEIQDLLEERIRLELAGKRQVKVTPTVLKIAAGQNNITGQNKEKGWTAPSIHVHMNTLSDEQLKEYYEKGILPEHLKNLLPANRSNE